MPPDDAPPESSDSSSEPDFGPRGYLPQRAAKRARKIVLREEMSLGWPLASLAAGVLVLLAGVAFWFVDRAPADPFEPVVALSALEVGQAPVARVGGADLLLVRPSGTVRAFRAPQASAVWCGESDRIEGEDGSVWQLDGRLVGGPGESLEPVPVEVHDGVVYAAPTAARPPVPASDRGETPVCTDGDADAWRTAAAGGTYTSYRNIVADTGMSWATAARGSTSAR